MAPKKKATKNPRKHPINLKLLSDDYGLLKRFADQDIRSMTNYVYILLIKHLRERSKTSQPPSSPS